MVYSFTGYVVQYRGLSVYFGGDTAYTRLPCDGRALSEHRSSDFAIAPIEPRAFMCRAHTDPNEALMAFRDLGARYMLPMHFDPFINAFDEYGAAPRKLRELLPRYGLDEGRVAILTHGQQHVFVSAQLGP